MAFKVFLDANVVLDFTLKRDRYTTAKTIMVWVEQQKIRAFVSPTVVQICAYWLTKTYGVAKTKEIMTTLLSIVTVVDTPHEQVLSALHSSMDDIEDALLYYTALHHGLDYVISQDKTFQKRALPSLPVISAEDFVRNLYRES